MANLFLTDRCGRNCLFCFAQIGPWSETYRPRALTIEEVSEFFTIPGSGQTRELGLIGGEPLLHPQLVDIMNLLWDHG